MIKNLVAVLGAIVSIGATASAQVGSPYGYSEIRGRNNQFERSNARQEYRQNPYSRGGEPTGSVADQKAGDAAMVAAVNGRRNINFVEATGMLVVETLPDDRQGLQHQKFVVQLTSGATMLAVYNLDMEGCTYIPVKKGDRVAMGGEFKWTSQGALLHWLHYDPSQRRPDGYVQLNGVDYCRSGRRH